MNRRLYRPGPEAQRCAGGSRSTQLRCGRGPGQSAWHRMKNSFDSRSPELPAPGRVALVTGAGARLGRAIALALAETGAHVAVHYHRNEPGALRTCSQVSERGVRSLALAADLTDAAACQELIAATEAQLGPLELLVNNAAIFEPSPAEAAGAEDFDRHMAANARPVYLLSREAGRRMRARGRGSIVNIADVAGERPWPGYLGYSASKAAVLSLTRGLARALAPEVRVNAVSPGPILAPAGGSAEQMDRAVASTLLGRAGTPEEVAAAVCLLAGCDWLTGVVLNVDGGRSLT